MRRSRIGLHLAIGLGLWAIIGVSSMDTVADFVLLVALFYAGGSSLTDAAWLWINETSGSTDTGAGLEPISLVDRVVVAAIRRSNNRRADLVVTEPPQRVVVS